MGDPGAFERGDASQCDQRRGTDTQKDQRNGVDRRGTSAAEKASPPLGGSMGGRSGGSISQNGEAWIDGFVFLAYLTPGVGSLVEPQ